MDVVPAMAGLCGLSLRRGEGIWPYALVRTEDGEVLKEWNMPDGWWTPRAGGSQNGKFIACMAREGVEAAGYDFSGPERARVALIDVERRELVWVADLVGHGAGTVRMIVISDDGRYIAVAGWNNGTAMVDAKEGKVIWAKRPEHEISTGYAAFAPGGNVLYTAGSEGCVYCINCEDGSVEKELWATSTGESIYGHRISALAVSSDGKWLAAGTGPEGEVYVWNLEGDGKPHVLQHEDGCSIEIVAFSPDSKNVVSVGGGRLKVWRLPFRY